MIEKLVYFAQFAKRENCSEAEQKASCLSTLPEVTANEAAIKSGLTVLFGVFAAVAAIVIIVGAINFATAEGNPEGISKAKKTIIYALIGLVISLSAEAAVLTLIGRL